MAERPTQAQLAIRLGISRATVSRALNGSPLLPVTTRQRVSRLADQLGYRPDPLLSALANRRARRSTRGGRSVWALVHTGGLEGVGFKAVADVASERGYTLTPIRLPRNAAAFDRQLEALAASGVLVSSLRDGAQIRAFDWSNLQWDRRSWLAIGVARWVTPIHVVRGSPVEGMALALSRMLGQGFRRIAVLREHPSLSTLNELQGAGIALAMARCRDLRLYDCPLLPRQPVPTEVSGWRPQALLMGFSALHQRLSPRLAALPWASLGLAGARSAGLAGVFYDPVVRARAAVDWLDALVRRGERGIPTTPCCLEFAPQWREGVSMR